MTRKRSNLLGIASVAALLVVIGSVAAIQAFAAPVKESKESKETLEHFLIISPHTPAQCLAVLDDMAAKEPQMLASADWGCKAGDHTAYMNVAAPNAEAAKTVVPELVRAQAKVIRLNKFTPEQIKAFHQTS